MQIQKTLSELIAAKIVFTDVYVRTGEPMRARTPSGWVAVNKDDVTREDMQSFLKIVAGQDWEAKLKASPTLSLDIAKTIGGSARLRCNIAYSGSPEEVIDHQPTDDITISIRKLSLVPPDFSELGLPARLLQDMLSKKGLWIVTGPTGNGKSTTLASVLQYMNANQSSHIVTIEQPIEYILRPQKSIISQKEVGNHVPSFNAGLIAAMRQRPDVILIGEVRDQDTMETLLQAGESGHLVLASLHTKNAVDAITKVTGFLQGSGSTSNKLNALASILVGVVAQNLVPSADGKNLVLAYEILMNTPEVAQLIRREEFQKLPNALEAGRKAGSVPLNDRLKELLMMKKIKDATADAVSNDPLALNKEKYA
jgi:twitching motility protein PilT